MLYQVHLSIFISGRDRMLLIVRYTTACAISAYHH